MASVPFLVDASSRLSVDAPLLAAVLVAALTITTLWALHHLFSSKQATGTDLPRPAPMAPYMLPVLKHTLQLIRTAPRHHDWVVELMERHSHGGRPFRVQQLGSPAFTILPSVALFEDVLKTQFECFPKGEVMCGNLDGLLGHGIFAVDGAQWSHQRKTASHLFTARKLRESMAHTLHQLLPELLVVLQQSAATGHALDLCKLLNRFTMEGFARIGFGIELDALDAPQDHPFMAAFDRAQRAIMKRFLYPHWVWRLKRLLNVGSEAELRRDRQVIDSTVMRIISESLAQRQRPGTGHACEGAGAGGAGTDPDADANGVEGATAVAMQSRTPRTIVSLFLDSMDQHQHDTDEPFDPRFLRDVVVNFLIAGRDTTAQTLSWLFYELSEHPEVETRLREELRTNLPAADCRALSMEQVAQLPFMEAVIRETLRLHPPVPLNLKTAARDTVLVDGTLIQAGSAVAIPSYAMGRMTHVWGPDAKSFRPVRWLDPRDPTRLVTVSAFQFIAFFAGPRTCLGMNLAMMEMKMLLAAVLSQFHLRAVAGQHVGYELSVTLPMKHAFMTHVDVA